MFTCGSEKDLRKMIDDGMTTKQMANAVGVPYQTMYMRLKSAGIENPNKERHRRRGKPISIPKKKPWYEGKSRDYILRHYEKLGYHVMSKDELRMCLMKDEQIKDINMGLDELK